MQVLVKRDRYLQSHQVVMMKANNTVKMKRLATDLTSRESISVLKRKESHFSDLDRKNENF